LTEDLNYHVLKREALTFWDAPLDQPAGTYSLDVLRATVRRYLPPTSKISLPSLSLCLSYISEGKCRTYMWWKRSKISPYYRMPIHLLLNLQFYDYTVISNCLFFFSTGALFVYNRHSPNTEESPFVNNSNQSGMVHYWLRNEGYWNLKSLPIILLGYAMDNFRKL